MTSIIFTNINHYLTTHEAFRLENIAKWIEHTGAYVFVRRLDASPVIHHPRIWYSSVSPTDANLKTEIRAMLSAVPHGRVINLLEKFFPWDLVETDAERIYFVRSCAAKLHRVLRNYGADTETLAMYDQLRYQEYRYLALSDTLITDSVNSQRSVTEMYGRESSLCLEYIDPTQYNTVPSPTDRSFVYNVGRRDFQKGLHFVRPPTRHRFLSVGQPEVGKADRVADNMSLMDCVSFDEYQSHIAPAYFGIFPSIWESNGYAVQECLAMGKIPVVQQGSGGNERLCTSSNSIVLDFDQGQTDWETVLDGIDNVNTMSEAARSTITHEMYAQSRDRFLALL